MEPIQEFGEWTAYMCTLIFSSFCDRNENGSTPLHTAAGNGADDIVKFLLDLPAVNPVSYALTFNS